VTTELRGGCLCGRVRYRLRGEPLAFYACHCTDCQRQSGAAFGLSMIVQRDQVDEIVGEPATFEVGMPDGRTKRGCYCGSCAARVWGEPVKLPEIRVLRPGTLDDPGCWTPFGDIWTASARSWVRLTEGPHFEGQPEDPMALVRAWRGRDDPR
jgi:hypothetical protein